jgi:hypothetical protein
MLLGMSQSKWFGPKKETKNKIGLFKISLISK